MKTVAIIGMGLIGGSLGMAIKNKDLADKVIGVSRNIEHLKEAKSKEALDEYTIDIVEASRDADLIFVTTPISLIAPTVKTVAGIAKKGAIITDAGSSKAQIVNEIESSIPAEINFIGGHPMAGTDASGIYAATKFLFEGANYILTPTNRTNIEALKILNKFLEKLDVQILEMPPEKHDIVIAAISHMPLAIAVSLVNAIFDEKENKEDMIKTASSGFRDTTRIAAGNVEMGKDMFITNKDAVLQMIGKFKKSLDDIEQAIKESNKDKIVTLLEKAKKLRVNMYAS